MASTLRLQMPQAIKPKSNYRTGNGYASALVKATPCGFPKGAQAGQVRAVLVVDPTRDRARFRRPFTAQHSRTFSRNLACKRAIKWACKDSNAPQRLKGVYFLGGHKKESHAMAKISPRTSTAMRITAHTRTTRRTI